MGSQNRDPTEERQKASSQQQRENGKNKGKTKDNSYAATKRRPDLRSMGGIELKAEVKLIEYLMHFNILTDLRMTDRLTENEANHSILKQHMENSGGGKGK